MAERARLTDGQEIGAYAAAHVIKVAAAWATARFYAPALFGWAYAKAGPMGITFASMAQGAAWGAVGLAIFLALRPSIGGTPEIVRRAGGQATAGFEIGAYALAQAIGILAGYMVFAAVLPVLHPQGRTGLLTVVSLGVGAVVAAAEFVLFVFLRRIFAGRAVTVA